MDNQTVQRLKDLILKNQEIAVVVKKDPTLDDMAAGLGLFLTIKQMGKNVTIACPTDPLVGISNLVGIDKVQKIIGGGDGGSGDLTVSFPYREGEIEKVSYTLDNGLLNIVVKAGEKGLSFQQSDVNFIRGGKMPTLVFYVGVPHVSDVASLMVSDPGIEVVNIDNHADNEKYGTVTIVDPKWSSVSEQIADFVTLLEPQVEVDVDTAQNLLQGISFATQDFQSPTTSYLAFEVAGILMKKGAIRPRVGSPLPQPGAGSSFFPPIPEQKQPVAQQQPMYTAPVAPQPTYTAPIAQQPTQWDNQQQQQQPVVAMPQQQAPVAAPQPMVQEPQPAPMQPQQPTQIPTRQAPPDWLTPKVYKGSSIL